MFIFFHASLFPARGWSKPAYAADGSAAVALPSSMSRILTTSSCSASGSAAASVGVIWAVVAYCVNGRVRSAKVGEDLADMSLLLCRPSLP